MKKQELIHIHGLLAEVRDECENWEDLDPDFSEYRNHGVQPTSIHKSKTDHKAAVFKLARGITDSMETEQDALTAHAD